MYLLAAGAVAGGLVTGAPVHLARNDAVEPRDFVQHAVLRIDIAQLDVESRKPLMDSQGNLLSSAPRWFLEATGMISPRRPTSGAMAA